MTAYVDNDQSRSDDVCIVVSSSRVIPNHVNHALCAFVEYPASALLSEEQERGVKGRRGGGGDDVEEDEGEGGRRYLANFTYGNVTLYSYLVNI